jgi:hypothetical protein
VITMEQRRKLFGAHKMSLFNGVPGCSVSRTETSCEGCSLCNKNKIILDNGAPCSNSFLSGLKTSIGTRPHI